MQSNPEQPIRTESKSKWMQTRKVLVHVTCDQEPQELLERMRTMLQAIPGGVLLMKNTYVERFLPQIYLDIPSLKQVELTADQKAKHHIESIIFRVSVDARMLCSEIEGPVREHVDPLKGVHSVYVTDDYGMDW